MIVAGVLSAVYGIAINDVAKPIIDVAAQHGAGVWRGNIGYVFVNSGTFVTALLYSLFLAKKPLPGRADAAASRPGTGQPGGQ